jgi:polar amino acid transport system substrate-binding protein
MAELLGLELRVENVEFGALVEGRTRDFDLALSQITKTPEREAIAKYSDGYFASDQGVLAVRGTEVSTLDDAKALAWGVQRGTTSEALLVGTIRPAREPRVYAQASDLFAALLAGDIQAVLFDTVTLLRQAKQPGYENTEVVGQFVTSEVYGALLPQDTKNLAAVNTLIDRFRGEGDIDAWADRYLPPEPDVGIGGNPAEVPVIPL